MRRLKRLFHILLLAFILLFVLRNELFRFCVAYNPIGNRPAYLATDTALVQFLEPYTRTGVNVKTIIKQALSATSKQLTFTDAPCETDPNKLIHKGTTHCVGYASFFATACNYNLKNHHLDDTWVAYAQAGNLYFLGANVHPFFHSPFFKDHDFAIVENKQTGEKFAVDPTVADYLWIDFITLKGN